MRWMQCILALSIGALAAAISGLEVPPWTAFIAGSLLAAAWFAVRPGQREAAEAELPAGDLTEGEGRQPEVSADFGRTLVEKLPTPLLLIARSGRVSYANPAAQAALPRVMADVHFASVMRAPAFVEAVSATLNDGQDRRVHFTADPARERFYDARVALLPPGGAFGPEALAIVQIEDQTDTRRSEATRSDFIANASHELRTPLASIIGYIETLQHHARDDAEARERFLGIMAREAGRMQRLVNDLMSLSRIEMTEHQRPAEALSLNQIAAESAAALSPVAAQQDVKLVIEVPDEGNPVIGDRDQLEQVFTNLIDNAMKYGGPGSQVRVHPAEPNRAHPGRYGISITDNGPGIGREHLHRLTERFYRVNAASSRNKGGTGLGLAIVKHILNRHEGRLEIASALGKGSTFTVWLPQCDAGTDQDELEKRRSA